MFWPHLAIPMGDDPEGRLVGKRWFVAPLLSQCVIHIRKANDPCCEGDRLAFQSEGIAAPIVSLVMGQGDLAGHFQPGCVA